MDDDIDITPEDIKEFVRSLSNGSGGTPDLPKGPRELVTFIRDLRDDLAQNEDRWAHTDLRGYLDSIAAWIEDTDTINAEVPSWELFSEILRAGRSYE